MANAEAANLNPDTLVGQTLAGRYRVIDMLAKGGMGRIYRAEQIELGRLVALKVLEETGDDPEGFRKRFTLEAATSARLSHPNIVIVHDYGTFEAGGARRYFMALELIDGRTLHQVVKEGGALEPGRAAWMTREILRALREAHRQGVVHRDLKPSNVMIVSRTDGDHVKVLDFGIAKVVQHDGAEEITREGAFVGTPRYMSPEQLTSRPVDARSDLFSLGVVLYQMLSGKPPHAGMDMMQAMVAHLNEAPPELPEPYAQSTPEALKKILRRALQREAQDRFQDASEFLRAIDNAGVGLSGWSAPTHSGEMALSGERTPLSSDRLSAVVPVPLSADVELPTSAATPAARARTTGSHSAPAAPASRAPLYGGIALASIALLALASWALGMGASVTTSTPPESVVLAPPPPTTTAPIAPTSFRLLVESDPSGASVLEDGVAVGTAPLSLELSLEATRQRPALLTVQLAGYAPYQFSQGPSATDVTVRAPLIALAPTPAATPTTPTTRVRREVRVHHDDPTHTPAPEDRMLKTRR